MTKSAALVLALLLCLTACAEGVTIVDGVLTHYDGNEADVVVPENVLQIAPDAFAGNDSVQSLTIGQNVLSISADAFTNCRNLKWVRIEFSDGTDYVLDLTQFWTVVDTAEAKLNETVAQAERIGNNIVMNWDGFVEQTGDLAGLAKDTMADVMVATAACGEAVSEAMNELGTALNEAGTAIGEAMDGLGAALNDAGTAIGEAADSAMEELGTAASGALDELGGLADAAGSYIGSWFK